MAARFFPFDLIDGVYVATDEPERALDCLRRHGEPYHIGSTVKLPPGAVIDIAHQRFGIKGEVTLTQVRASRRPGWTAPGTYPHYYELTTD